MLTYDATFDLSRQRLESTQARATLMGTLGQLPRPQALFSFRRTVRPLLATVEVRHCPEKARLQRRMVDLARNRSRAS